MHNYSFGYYSYILIATMIVGILIPVVLWPHRKFKAAFWVIVLEFAAAEWAFGLMFEVAATTIPLKQFWSAVAYIGTGLVPPSFFLFAIDYNRGKLATSRRMLGFLSIIPVIMTLLAFTNPWHSWLWPTVTITPGTNIAVYGHGIVWWFYYSYQYAQILPALFFLLKSAFKSGSFYAPHNLSIIIGALIPISGNLIYVFGPNPVPGLDWAPVGFALSGIVLTWGILRLKLLRLAPIAHTFLVENMVDSMIVLDTDNLIVDINPASAATFRLTPKQMIGQKVTQFFPMVKNVDNFLQSPEYAQVEVDLGDIQPDRQFELRLSILPDQLSQTIGKSLILRDITEKKQAEAEREKLIRDLQEALHQVKTLSGLLPICAHCKKIRDDKGYWNDVETYIQHHSDADFSHGICPDCLDKYYPEIAARMKAKREKEEHS